MTARYTVETGSNSGHCCFAASVIDTQNPESDAICECYERTDAEKIAALLNAAEKAGRATTQCPDCGGTGDAMAILGDGSVEVTGCCDRCKGSGEIAK